MRCPRCNSEMVNDYDYINRVRVLACSKPTGLHRVYPDYPQRRGDEEACYTCRRIFTVNPGDTGILCPEWREKVRARKRHIDSTKQLLKLQKTA